MTISATCPVNEFYMIKVGCKFFFLEVCLMGLAEAKIINCVPDRILHICPKPFLQQYCVTKLCWYQNLVSILLKIAGIVSVLI